MKQKKQNFSSWNINNKNNNVVKVSMDKPFFQNDKITFLDKIKLLLSPQNFLLYYWIYKYLKKQKRTIKILVINSGVGSTLIDFKRLFGRKVEVVGVEIINLQNDIARENIKKSGVWAKVKWYDGQSLPFIEEEFDVVYSFGILKNNDLQSWLKEINRVLKNKGILTLFAESKIGKHSFLNKFFLKHKLNLVLHNQSLYSKIILQEYLEQANFKIKKMYSGFCHSFFSNPDKFYPLLQTQKGFFFLKKINKVLYNLKNKKSSFFHYFFNLNKLIKILIIGRLIENQGYVILGEKKE